MLKRVLVILTIMTTAIALAACRAERLTIVTTTSLENSGLLDEILPHFEAEYGMKTRVVAVGTGAALEMGRLGQADILLVHDEKMELAFMGDGYGGQRETFAHNDFLIAGADALSADSLADALLSLHDNHTFYSRGDDSGTHVRELHLWKSHGYDPATFGRWYKETGQGMGSTLNIAALAGGYTLTDRGTYLALRQELDITVAYAEPENEDLQNPYSIIKVATSVRGGDGDAARRFFAWFTSAATQELIGEYRVDGERLFIPEEE